MILNLLPSEMKLADTIKLFDGPWGFAIVSKITETDIEVFRPYGATADFSYTGGVITYHGTENVVLPLTSTRRYEVHERKSLR